MDREELEKMRLGICQEYGIQYYKAYSLEQTAHILKKDVSTIKRWKRTGVVFPVVDPSGKGLHFLGFQIADIILGVHKPWQNTQSENTASENTGSGNEAKAPHGTDVGSKVEGSDALRLARNLLKKPKSV